ncbi:aldo/keto reductase [Cochlodiniinecator piscidefendens]|uniref:aldo/keto reductase n=1 Tax=Cochlodiniinecator piscidefendens TaxID=2715756 RepID=UPI001408E8C8|nr:aldo/keto reductase [Cochlodiniinecator piscidefendens]
MRYVPLGQTDLKISELCLGSMTWGTQNTTAEGHAQIDMALDHGVNCIDTAEMYPVNPISAETVGDTEKVIGEWFERTGRRDEVILATKHSGEGFSYVRDGAPISSKIIFDTVEGNLKRLKTDYIDLYQLHWPNRGSYQFRKNWSYDPSGQNKSETLAHIEDTLEALQKLVDQGKIRHFGLSNESAWGTAQWVRMSEDRGWPRVASMQNEYSMLCRLFDTDMSELCVNEDVTLLAFSPLATGLLTGKYDEHTTPEGSRRALNGDLGGRVSPRVWDAVRAYGEIADKHGLSLPQMALAWCRTRPFVTSAIFGATTLEQLKTALGSTEVVLSDEVIADIDAAHYRHPMPY